jgi:glycosyltransferase involved in cell wall biosynthesis
MKNEIDLSVICATHNGRKKIKNLLNSIYKNYVRPKEIVICGTAYSDTCLINKNIIKELNIKFIFSKIKNQIHQRGQAFKNSSGQYILQIDDDVIINPDFFLKLKKYTVNKKGLNKKIISALILLKNNTLQAGQWNTIYKKYLVFRFVIWILNRGKNVEEYSVIESGRCVPYIKDYNKKLNRNLTGAQWLCSTVIYHRSCFDSVVKLPQISKKAYYEDVFFSHQLYLKGYDLIIDKNIVGTHDNQPYTNIATYFKTLKTQFNVVKFFNKSKVFFFNRCVDFYYNSPN